MARVERKPSVYCQFGMRRHFGAVELDQLGPRSGVPHNILPRAGATLALGETQVIAQNFSAIINRSSIRKSANAQFQIR